MKTEMLNPKFCYGQKVRVIKGFHRNRKGTVINYYDTMCAVRFGWSWFGLNDNYENILISDLEAL